MSGLHNSFTGMRMSDRGTGWRIQGYKATQETSVQHPNAEQGGDMGRNENWRKNGARDNKEEGPRLNPREQKRAQHSLGQHMRFQLKQQD